jgi:iron complex outermembrane receptor protein
MKLEIRDTSRPLARRATWIRAIGLLLPLLTGTVAFAQEETLQEVIVTAQKREENVKDVPMTISVLGAAQIEAQGLTGLRDYSSEVPGMIYNGSGLGERSGPDIVIRGIANSRLFDFETNIATNTTGFAYGDLPAYAFDPELIDVQRIEVLKGPQGTLYGASAMGGLVKVVPNLPQFTSFTATAQGGFSTINSGWAANGPGWNFSTVVNVPISDVLAVRFSGHASQDPGYINIHLLSGNPNQEMGPNGLVPFNSLSGNVYGAGEFLKDVNEDHSSGGRIAVRFKPNEQFDATLAFLYDAKSSASLPNYEPVLSTTQNPLVANQYQTQPTSTEYSLASLEMSYDFGPATLHSITGWIDRDHSDSVDFAGTTYGALGGNGDVPLPTPAPVTFVVNTRIISQELRLQGSEKDLLWSGSGLDWTIGGFYQKEKRSAYGDVTVGADWLTEAQAPLTPPPSGTTTVWDGLYDSTYTNKSVFGDVTLHITPRLAVSGGARHSSQNVDATRTDFSDVFASAPPMGSTTIQEPVSESKTTPRAAVTYAATDEATLYAAYSQGFRIGGHNPIGNLTTPGCADALAHFGITNPEDAAEFKSDAITNYELGIKTAFDSGRVTANLTGFREDWSDLQTAIQLDQYSNSCGASFVTNAGAARIYGAELDVRAIIADHWRVVLAGQYADGKIVEVVPGGSGTLNAPLESAPKTQVSGGIEYQMIPRPEWTATARADYAYVGARNLSNTNTPVDPNYQLPGYGELNLRFSAAHGAWEYTAFVTNVTNAIPQLGIEIFAGGPGNYTGAFAPGSQRFITTSAPRTFGIMLKTTL